MHNIKKTQENTENGRHYAKHQMQTKIWKASNIHPKVKNNK